MNGPEHYREADVILTSDDGTCEYGCPHSGCVHEMAHLARAQVHATLALAAAVGGLDATEGPNGGAATGRADAVAWQEVILRDG